MADEVVVKFLGKKQSLTVNMHAWHPWVFDPFCVMTAKEYVGAKGYWAENAQDFALALPGEYEAHLKAIEAKLATIFYCGDSGGATTKGFCAKRTCGGKKIEAGERCEHHGGEDAELQGHYGPPTMRPEKYGGGFAPGTEPVEAVPAEVVAE